MGIRFQRRIQIAPGIRLNVGKRGLSTSIGPRGSSVTIGKNGVYGNAGVPGTGLSYRTKLLGGNTGAANSRSNAQSQIEQREKERLERLSSINILLDEPSGNIVLKDSNNNEIIGKDKTLVFKNHSDLIHEWLEDKAFKINGDETLFEQIHVDSPPLSQHPNYEPEEFDEQPPSEPEKVSGLPEPKLKEVPPLNFISKLFESKREAHKTQTELAEKQYRDDIARWKEQLENGELTYENDLRHWKEQTELWERRRDMHNLDQRKKAMDFDSHIRTNISFMESMLENNLMILDWPRETLISFQIENDGGTVWLDVDLPEIEDLPQKTATIAVNRKKLNIKQKSQTQLRKEYLSHICGIGLRLACNTLATLPSSKTIIVSGFSQRIDKSTGNINEDYLFSVKFTRDKLSILNFDNLGAVDPVASMENFDLVRNTTKTGIIKPIEPFSR